MVSIPYGLKSLVQESSVFQELIEGSTAPLRMSWTSIEVVNFVSSAAFFHLGYNVIANLAPHVLSTLLSETCKILEDPHYFHDPWDHENIQKFLHILKIFSLNFKCKNNDKNFSLCHTNLILIYLYKLFIFYFIGFCAFMSNIKESYSNEEHNYPLNLSELFNDSINPESNYHYLGLLSLNIVIWNLNICLYLLELLNFQVIHLHAIRLRYFDLFFFIFL